MAGEQQSGKKQIKNPSQMNEMVKVTKKSTVIVTCLLVVVTVAVIVLCCIGNIETKEQHKAMLISVNGYDDMDGVFESYTPEGQEKQDWTDFYGIEKTDQYGTFLIPVSDADNAGNRINTGLTVRTDGDTKGVIIFNGASVFYTYDEMKEMFGMDDQTCSDIGIFPEQNYEMVYFIAPMKEEMEEQTIVSCEVITETIRLSELIIK